MGGRLPTPDAGWGQRAYAVLGSFRRGSWAEASPLAQPLAGRRWKSRAASTELQGRQSPCPHTAGHQQARCPCGSARLWLWAPSELVAIAKTFCISHLFFFSPFFFKCKCKSPKWLTFLPRQWPQNRESNPQKCFLLKITYISSSFAYTKVTQPNPLMVQLCGLRNTTALTKLLSDVEQHFSSLLKYHIATPFLACQHPFSLALLPVPLKIRYMLPSSLELYELNIHPRMP